MYQQHSGVPNNLSLTVPGIKHVINIPFPARRLPSCDKCKRHYKTRELCREVKKHNGLPWTKVFICMTLDPSCYDERTNRFLVADYADLTASPTETLPYQLKPDVEVDPNMPMCLDCKNKNYTRVSCRGKKGNSHRYLPWGTVYVTLSSPSRSNMGGHSSGQHPSMPSHHDHSTANHPSPDDNKHQESDVGGAGQEKRKSSGGDGEEENGDEGRSKRVRTSVGESENATDPSTPQNAVVEFDIMNVDKSRTIYAEVSSKGCTFRWVDYDEDKANAVAQSKRRTEHSAHSKLDHSPYTSSMASGGRGDVSSNGYPPPHYYQPPSWGPHSYYAPPHYPPHHYGHSSHYPYYGQPGAPPEHHGYPPQGGSHESYHHHHQQPPPSVAGRTPPGYHHDPNHPGVQSSYTFGMHGGGGDSYSHHGHPMVSPQTPNMPPDGGGEAGNNESNSNSGGGSGAGGAPPPNSEGDSRGGGGHAHHPPPYNGSPSSSSRPGVDQRSPYPPPPYYHQPHGPPPPGHHHQHSMSGPPQHHPPPYEGEDPSGGQPNNTGENPSVNQSESSAAPAPNES